MSKEVHIKTYDEWLKYYENVTKEQVIEDLTRDVQYFADAVKDIKDLQQELDKYKNIVDELNVKTDYIEELLLIIAKSNDYKIQKEVYEKGIEYDKKLKKIKGSGS